MPTVTLRTCTLFCAYVVLKKKKFQHYHFKLAPSILIRQYRKECRGISVILMWMKHITLQTLNPWAMEGSRGELYHLKNF